MTNPPPDDPALDWADEPTREDLIKRFTQPWSPPVQQTPELDEINELTRQLQNKPIRFAPVDPNDPDQIQQAQDLTERYKNGDPKLVAWQFLNMRPIDVTYDGVCCALCEESLPEWSEAYVADTSEGQIVYLCQDRRACKIRAEGRVLMMAVSSEEGRNI